MTKSRDRTEDFKDAVRISAISSGFTESKLALVMSSFIMHKPTHRLPFTKAALKTLESINELDHFILKHQKDYLNLHRTTEQERDNIEHEVSIFVKASKEQIDILKNRIHDEVKHENTTWLPMISDGSHADEVAHKHGVVLILSERLHSVTANFDKLRSVRIQDAINRAMPRRKKHAVPTTKSSEVLNKSDFTEVVSHEVSTEPTTSQNQTLEYETRALQVELTRLLDAVQETETKMVEMSALNHLMSVHVLQQAQQIELLYEQAVEATQNVELGNRELSQAIKRNSSSRTFLLLFFFVLTFSVIFLDWYS